MGQVVSFLSGKGGTGKTSLCAAVGSCLSALGDRVLCIDLDMGLRNLDIALGMSSEALLTFADVMEGRYILDDVAPCEKLAGLKLLTAPVSSAPEDVDEEAFSEFLSRCRESFDWILLDAPAGVGTGFRLAVQDAEQIILVTGGEPAALRDGARAAAMAYAREDAQVRCIVNRVSARLFRRMKRTVDDAMDAVGLPLLGIVPEDSRVPLAAAKDTPLVLTGRRGASAACLRIAKRLKELPAPLRLR